MARGGDARGTQKAGGNVAYVRVSNPAWNGSPVIRRKDAKHYVTTGRAVWLCNHGDDSDQIRLLDSHPTNRAITAEAATGYRRAAAVMIRRPEELRHIPVLLPRKALTDRTIRVQRHFAGRSGPVRTQQ
jgi:hypothetical protein